ncbi:MULTISPECIES: hypothetical protein [Paenibacillus]|nr:hypothetical protein [Paenibacillus lautus]
MCALPMIIDDVLMITQYRTATSLSMDYIPIIDACRFRRLS